MIHYSQTQRKNNIRKLSTAELKTYNAAYKRNQVYKFARDTALAELRKRARVKSHPIKRRKARRTNNIFGLPSRYPKFF